MKCRLMFIKLNKSKVLTDLELGFIRTRVGIEELIPESEIEYPKYLLMEVYYE